MSRSLPMNRVPSGMPRAIAAGSCGRPSDLRPTLLWPHGQRCRSRVRRIGCITYGQMLVACACEARMPRDGLDAPRPVSRFVTSPRSEASRAGTGFSRERSGEDEGWSFGQGLTSSRGIELREHIVLELLADDSAVVGTAPEEWSSVLLSSDFSHSISRCTSRYISRCISHSTSCRISRFLSRLCFPLYFPL